MPSQSSTFAALNHREFRRFYTGSIASQLGFWFSHISFQDLMSDLTDDEFWVAMIFVATFAPVLVLGPFGGLLADRLDRKKLLLGTYVALIATALIQVALVVTDSVTPARLLMTSALVGVTMAVLGPTVQAITANTVPPKDLASAISLQAMASNGSRVIGPALAAPLVRQDLFEITWGIYAFGASIALIVASGLTLLPYARDTTDVAVFAQLRAGVRHARERKPAGRALMLVAVTSTFAVSHIALAPAFTRDALGRPAGDFAWLGVATGAGALIGALAAGSLARTATLRRGAALAIPYAGLIVVFSQVTSFTLALGVQVVAGFFYIASFTTVQVLVQEIVDEQLRGRIMSLFQIAWAGLIPIGSFIMGLMAGKQGLDLGAANTIGIAGLVSLGYASWVWYSEGRSPSTPRVER